MQDVVKVCNWLERMKAFVTGGSGFIGTNLIHQLLADGVEVRAMVRSTSAIAHLKTLPVELAYTDLYSSKLAFHLDGCEVLFHMAAHYSLFQSEVNQLLESNVLGTRNILAAAKEAGIRRTVYTSSVAAIGVKPDGTPATEAYQSPPEDLISAYKRSKYWAEQEALTAAREGQDIVIVNPTSPIGPWDGKPTPTGEIILRFLRRQMPAVVDTGLNFINVQDVCQGHVLALEKGKSGDRYILGHQNLTLQDFLSQLAEVTGLPAPRLKIPHWIPLGAAWVDEMVLPQFGKVPTLALDGVRMSQQKMYYDAEKAVQELGLPQTDLRSALSSAVDWFRSNRYV
jgi:dihydroflavonol-4-reductase